MKKKKRKRATGAGRQRLVPGELSVNVGITITQGQIDCLRKIGHGNLSFGIRCVLEAYEEGEGLK